MDVKRLFPKPFHPIIALRFPLAILAILLEFTEAGAFSENLPVGARSLAMGGAYVALADGPDAVFLNPGGLAQISGTAVALFYQKPFGLEDVNFGTATATVPVAGYRVSIGFMNLGNPLYDQTEIAVALSHHFRDIFYYGVALRYQSTQIESFGSSGTVGVGFGVVAPLGERLSLGFEATNLNRPRLGKAQEELPQTFKSGLSLFAAPSLILSVEIFKDVRYSEELRFGTEFRPLERLALRAGAASNPSRFSAGFGVAVDPFHVDYAFFTHNDLGLTHQVSFTVHLGEQRPAKERVSIPSHMESDPEGVSRLGADPIDINSADIEALAKLPGIGEKTAAAIVDYRLTHGPFLKIEDLKQVKGIGTAKFEVVRAFITVR